MANVAILLLLLLGFLLLLFHPAVSLALFPGREVVIVPSASAPVEHPALSALCVVEPPLHQRPASARVGREGAGRGLVAVVGDGPPPSVGGALPPALSLS